jgi:MoxR-like ATPase
VANLATTLPSGTEFLTRPAGRKEPYGPLDRGLIIQVENGVSTLEERQADGVFHAIAAVFPDGKTPVLHPVITPLNLPYVNKFLVGTHREVKKNWRTGLYETRSTVGSNRAARRKANRAAAKAARVAPASATQHTAATDEMSTAKPVTLAQGATITVSGESNSPLANIPGIEFFTKEPLKGSGTGWTNMSGIILPNDQLEELNDAWDAAQAGEVSATLITGPAGTAKTMLVRAFAKSLGVPYLKVDAGSVRTVDDWSGMLRQDPSTTTWAHKWSPFALALRAGLPVIIHVDELTRTDTPAALNAFMGLLDETGTMLVPDANTVLRMPKGILLIATANIGPEFVGTLPLDGAVRQRFPYGFRMAPPPEGQEAKLLVQRTGVTADVAQRLVRLAVEQRKNRDDAQAYPSGAVISTRVLLAVASKIAKGRDARKALSRTLSIQFDSGDDNAISVLIDTQFPKGWDTVPVVPTEGGATIQMDKHYFVPGSFGAVSCAWTFTDGSQCGQSQAMPIHLR